MKRSILISILIATGIILFVAAKTIGTVDKQEARNAFEYLNKVRQSPKDYSKEIGLNLHGIKPMPILIWNDTLAAVAEARAMDMATNNYFAHVNKKGEGVNILMNRGGYVLPKDFYKVKKNNFLESIAMGQETGVDAIKGLILDKGINPPGHRQHLLGMTKFWATCFDIGIGFVRTDNPEKPSYTCIIIARHDAPEGEIIR